MFITSSIPNGSGRVHRLTPSCYEIELIAYSKGSRYFCVEASSGEIDASIEISLVPDRWFRIKTFPYKCEADVWLCDADDRNWKRIENPERTPERVRFSIELKAGKHYLISSEPPYRYIDSSLELFSLAAKHPTLCSLHCLGASIEHRPIFALRISPKEEAPGSETRPVVHIVAGEHASEAAGEEIARGMLAYLLSPEGNEARRRFIFDIILNANPDGNYHGWHQYNTRDWHEHNYRDTVDRSWHHEFVPYLLGEERSYSPETEALMEWLKLTRPACYLSMHSWEGQGGSLGAFHAAAEGLEPEMAAAVNGLLSASEKVGSELGFPVHNYSSRTDHLHLGHLLMRSGAAAAYLPEGNYALGRERLQAYGAGLLDALVNDERVIPCDYDRSRWERLAESPHELRTSNCP